MSARGISMSPFVREGLHEVELSPLDVAEMHIEDLAALAEPADHREDLARRAGQASRTLAAVATGTTWPKKWSIRSQFSSSETMPAAVGGAAWSAWLQRKAALREPPRPGSRAVRGMPMMQRLYLAAGMPALASRSIRPKMLSISRCRPGSLPRRMCGLSASSIGRDDNGSCTMSSERPNDST